jgi:hypothetical protein
VSAACLLASPKTLIKTTLCTVFRYISRKCGIQGPVLYHAENIAENGFPPVLSLYLLCSRVSRDVQEQAPKRTPQVRPTPKMYKEILGLIWRVLNREQEYRGC